MKRAAVGLLFATLLLAAAVTGVGRSPHPAGAHTGDLGWIWFSNGYDYENILDNTTGSWNVPQAATDWLNNTNLYTNTLYGASYYEINYYSYYMGMGWGYGGAYVYSNNYTCGTAEYGPTGLCNKTTEKASYGILYMNLSENTDQIIRNMTSRHELGHVFGLSHANPPNCSSMLMDGGWCTPHLTYITSHDIGHANSLY